MNTRNNETMFYQGMIAKIEILVEDFICLGYGENFTEMIPLEKGFSLSAGETYSFRIDGFFYFMEGADIVIRDEQSRAIKVILAEDVIFYMDVVGFNLEITNCNNAQRATVQNAINEFIRLRNIGANNVNNRNAPAYRNFFGATNDAQHAFVRRIVTNIHAVPTANMNPTCGNAQCEANTYAFVFPGRHYNIFVCPLFFRSVVRGFDSIGGTLYHEMSHFTVIGGTTDIVYSRNQAMDLARRNPAQAVRNADNYQYFVETLLY